MDKKLKIKTNLFIYINIFFLASCSSYLSTSNYSSNQEKSTFWGSDKEVLYGINGHSVRVNRGEYTSQYNQFSIKEQVDFLKKLGVNIYRTDIYFNETGFFNGPDSPGKFEELIKLTKEAKIEVLPILSTYPWMKTYDDPTEPFLIGKDWNYPELIPHLKLLNLNGKKYIQSLEIWQHYFNRGLKSGVLFAATYGKDLMYYNTGNEIAYYISKMYPHPDNPIQNPTGEDSEKFFISTYGGDDITDFFSTEEHARRMVAATAYVKGLIDGIKSEDKEAKCIISDGKANLGFFKFLDYMNVDYDIIGWNWYVDGFNSNLLELNGRNVYQELSRQFNHKPIWITETNRYAGSRNYSEESVYRAEIDQANKIKNYVAEFSTLEKVEAVIVYELLDQEYKFESRWEDYYGLITSPFPDKSYSRFKPAFDTYRYTIEELSFSDDDFVYAVVNDLTNEEPSKEDIRFWKEQLQTKNLESIINEIYNQKSFHFDTNPVIIKNKTEFNQVVDSLYSAFLKRSPTKREIHYWKRQVKKGSSIDNIPMQLILSKEYWQNAIWTGYERRTGFQRPN